MYKNILTATSFVLFLFFGSSVWAQSTQEVEKQHKPETVKLKITGMTCSGCSSQLSNVLSKTPGILDNSVEYPGDIAVVEYDSEKIKTDEIIETIEKKTRFTAEVHKEDTEENKTGS